MLRTLLLSLLATLVLVPTAVAAVDAIDAAEAAELCVQRADETCGPGNGRRTPGGGEKVSHKGWPAVTGILWQVHHSRGVRLVGGDANDELLGHHGSDTIVGGPGHDILWGDWDPKNNNGRQRDVLRGGAGNDWIYPSHGRTKVLAGPGRDDVWAFYGRGTIDCGPGNDTVRIRMNGAFRVKNCETVNHFCAFGSNGRGGCLKPGEKTSRRR
jgi:Ca2+-binding RTX toxin-like protein